MVVQMFHQKLISKLSLIARDVEPIQSARICAAVVRKREIVSIAVNLMRSHPLQKRFSRNSASIYLHAEINAIKQAITQTRRDELVGHRLYVARVTKEKRHRHLPAMACPCEGCMKAVKFFGLDSVTYTLNAEGHLGVWEKDW